MQSFGARFCSITSGLVVLGTTFTAAAGSVPTYHVDDLGAVETPYASAVGGINRYGVVAGSMLLGDSLVCAVFDHGSIVSLGTLGGADCFANAIGDSGVVVGSSLLGGGSNSLHAFAYADGEMHDLSTSPGCPDSEAVGINVHGEIAGNTFDAFQEVAFTYHPGHFHRVAVPHHATDLAARAVSSLGDATGSAQFIDGHGHAFLYSNGKSHDLGTLGGLSNGDSEGLAINDKGQVAGWSSGEGFRMHAMLATSAAMVDLGTLPRHDPVATSQATGINHKGVVVGVSDDGAGTTVAFMHDSAGMHDMNELLEASQSTTWQLVSAQSINESGQIAGMAQLRGDGSLHVFLATPLK
jgi:probable HAF family extracellular repeat protein